MCGIGLCVVKDCCQDISTYGKLTDKLHKKMSKYRNKVELRYGVPFIYFVLALLTVTTAPVFAHAEKVKHCTYETFVRLSNEKNIREFAPILAGDDVTPECLEGYIPQRLDAAAHCDLDGNWKFYNNFVCVPSLSCIDNFDKSLARIIPLSGVSDRGYYSNQASVLYICNNGDDRRTIRCVDGSWSQSPPACGVPRCPENITVPHGQLKPHADFTLEVHCDPGYELKGGQLLYCDAQEEKWIVLKSNNTFPRCDPKKDIPPSRRPIYLSLHLIIAVSCVITIVIVLLVCLTCHLRREKPKRNRLMHTPSHVDELLHLRRTKPIVIPDPISHTQVHYTQDRKPIPVTSL